MMAEAGLSFPLIAKPDVGERGFLVKKILNEAHLHEHRATGPFYPPGIPHGARGNERSILPSARRKSRFRHHLGVRRKEFLTVRGDGRQSVRSLMRRHDRAALQLERFEAEKPDMLNESLLKASSVCWKTSATIARAPNFATPIT